MSNVIYLSDHHRRSDEELDFWGDIYLAAQIGDRLGVSFEQFLDAPHSHLIACGQESAPSKIRAGFRPLLPKQEVVIARLHASWRTQGLMDDTTKDEDQAIHSNETLLYEGATA
jgi:hypothetical protein